MDSSMKKCTKCKVNRTLNDFRYRKDGEYTRLCNSCLNINRIAKENNKCSHNKRSDRCNICNIKVCLRNNITKRMYQVLEYSDFDYLCCSIEEYIEYIESQFTGDMSWSNYGIIWQIDHILPIGRKDIPINERINRLVL